MTTFQEVFETGLRETPIMRFSFEDFKIDRRIGEGGFGVVHQTFWRSRNATVALKMLKTNEDTEAETDNRAIKRFLKELRLLDEVSHNQYLNHVYGVTQDPLTKQYALVLEYADRGNLREHLRTRFHQLTWNDKIQMAFQISSGLKCLHDHNIIHRDLHSMNILVRKGDIMVISDLGLSRRVIDGKAVISSGHEADNTGIACYIDPQLINQPDYFRNKESDIFSLGVLLWEISAGKPPFEGHNHWQVIAAYSRYHRESPVPETPPTYVNLYKGCWDTKPSDRPKINGVVDDLQLMKKSFFSALNLNAQPAETPIVDTSDMCGDNSSHTMTDESNIIKAETPVVDNSAATITSVHNTLDKHANKRKLVAEVMEYFLQEIGLQNSSEKPKLSEWISMHKDELESAYCDLNESPTNPDRELLMGYFRLRGLGVEEDDEKAFKFFKEAQLRDANNPSRPHGDMAVGYCKLKGIGTNKNVAEGIRLLALSAPSFTSQFRNISWNNILRHF